MIKFLKYILLIFDFSHYFRFDENTFYQQQQLTIVNQWKEWISRKFSPYKSIQEAGFRCYSQFEEDGIILYLLTIIGIRNGNLVEICCGDATQCMSSNLILNHGYKGYLIEGNKINYLKAKKFFKSKKDCAMFQPEIRNSWVTAENINQILVEMNCPEDIDFLSLDLDGNDYWVWEAINVIKPKVCCFEIHGIIPQSLSLTIPYDPYFKIGQKNKDFRSVSLLAMSKLSFKKGYRLVGGHKYGWNVFFVKEEYLSELIKEVEIEDVLLREAKDYGQKRRWNKVKNYPWQEI